MLRHVSIFIIILTFVIGVLNSYIAYGVEPMNVWITSPRNLEQVPATGFTIVGGSLDTNQADCEVMVKINGAEPYFQTNPTGSVGTSDFSTWQFVYTKPLLGLNSVIAKYLCWDNPTVDRYYTLYVESVPSDPTLTDTSSGSSVGGTDLTFYSSDEPDRSALVPGGGAAAAAAHGSNAAQAANPEEASDAAARPAMPFAASTVIEICYNQIDDDSDSLVDAEDPDCENEEAKKIEGLSEEEGLSEDEGLSDEGLSKDEGPPAEPADSNSEENEDM